MVPSLSPCPSCFYPFQLLRSVCFCLCPAPFSFLPSLPAVLLLHTQTPNIVSLLYIIDTICFSPCPSRSGINPFLSPAALYPSLFADLPGGIGVFPLRVPPRKNIPGIRPRLSIFRLPSSVSRFSPALPSCLFQVFFVIAQVLQVAVLRAGFSYLQGHPSQARKNSQTRLKLGFYWTNPHDN